MFNLIKLVKDKFEFVNSQEEGKDKETHNAGRLVACVLLVLYCICRSEFQYLKAIISKRLHTHTQRFILSDLSKQSGARRLITSRSSPSGSAWDWDWHWQWDCDCAWPRQRARVPVTIWIRIWVSLTLSRRRGGTPAQRLLEYRIRIRFLCTTWRLFMKHLA